MTRTLWASGYCRFPQRPFRRLFRLLERPVESGSSIVTAYTDGQVTLRSNRRLDGYHEAKDLSGFQGVEPGDFVVHGLDILRGSVGVSDASGAISSVCSVCEPLGNADPRFFAYAMRAQAYSGFPRAMARGIREGGADFRRWETLADLPLPEPSPPQQQAIADYLDAETARVDALIAKKRRMMDLAQERFLTLVSFLTQEGPEARVRHLTSLLTSGPRGWAELISETGPPFIRSANLQRTSVQIKTDNLVYVLPPRTVEAQRSSVCPGDVVMGITGANTGWVGFVPPMLAGGFVSQHVAILRPSHVEPEWLAYSLFSVRAQDQLLGGQYGGTKQQLGLQDLAELRIASPEREEQQRRVETIRNARRESERLIEALDRQIVLLAERRQALITAAVTGNAEVPGVAA